MPQRRRNAGLRANACGERESCAKSSAHLHHRQVRVDQLEERIPAQGKGTQEILSESLQTLERCAEGSNHAPHHRPIFQPGKVLQWGSLNSKLKYGAWRKKETQTASLVVLHPWRAIPKI